MNSKKHDEEHWTMKCKAGRQEKQLIKTEQPHGLKAGTNNGRRKEEER